MCAFTYVWSQDEDGGHTIRSVIANNPTIHSNLMALSFIELELWEIKVLHCGNRDFWLFLLLWPWPDDLHIRTWPVFSGDTLDVQIWTSYVKAFKSQFWLTYIKTDRQTLLEL